MGQSWGHLGALLDRFGLSWAVLGLSWAILGLSWPSGESLGSILGPSGAFSGRLGSLRRPPWASLRLSWGRAEPSMSRLALLEAPPGRLELTEAQKCENPKTMKHLREIIGCYFFVLSREAFGALLGRLAGLFEPS